MEDQGAGDDRQEVKVHGHVRPNQALIAISSRTSNPISLHADRCPGRYHLGTGGHHFGRKSWTDALSGVIGRLDMDPTGLTIDDHPP